MDTCPNPVMKRLVSTGSLQHSNGIGVIEFESKVKIVVMTLLHNLLQQMHLCVLLASRCFNVGIIALIRRTEVLARRGGCFTIIYDVSILLPRNSPIVSGHSVCIVLFQSSRESAL